MIFRRLPISVELEIGKIGGFIIGGEIKKNLFSFESLDIGAQGQLAYYLGKSEEWEIPGLPVEGTVKGKPSWIRATAGPVLTYSGFDSVHPYVYLAYNHFQGTFKMEQTIQDLTGNEKKDINGKDSFSFSLGAILEFTKTLHVKAEVNFIQNLDVGAQVKLMYSL